MRHGDFKYQMCIIAALLHFRFFRRGAPSRAEQGAECILEARKERRVLSTWLGVEMCSWRHHPDVIILHHAASCFAVCFNVTLHNLFIYFMFCTCLTSWRNGLEPPIIFWHFKGIVPSLDLKFPHFSTRHCVDGGFGGISQST